MVDARLAKVQESLNTLEKSRDLASAKRVVRNVSALLVPDLSDDVDSLFRLFNDQDGKLKANASWFFSDTTITDKLATYTLETPAESNLDIKIFGVKKAKKGTISWAVGLTPNFEDEPFNGKFNVGIDFIIPESLDRVLVALSKNYVIRTLELKGQLTATFQEILNSWLSVTDLSRKIEFHEILWNSLDLSPINKKFYEGISQRFIALRQHIETSGALDHEHAAQFSNRLIGRVIFTWFLDKKSLIEPSLKYFNSEDFSDDTEYYRQKLEPLFFEVLNTPVPDRKVPDVSTPYLNGGLFESKLGDLYNDLALTFPKNYFDDFFAFLRSYNFTTDESTTEFQQVAIDPEMLGRIFENLLAEVSEETGEQARKAKGAFYTPREIVDFMCRESLNEYLLRRLSSKKLPSKVLSHLIYSSERDFQDQDHNWRRDIKPYKASLIEALDELRVIDIACGSGAYPMGMMQLLLKVYSRLETRFDSKKTKFSIISKNLFGVDIEPMAVEISRLRIWLALIVESEVSGVQVEPLPNLDFKFVCANALGKLDNSTQITLFDDPSIGAKLQDLRARYFETTSAKKKGSLRTEYSTLIQGEPFLEGDSIRTFQLKSFDPFDSSSVSVFFDPEEMFGCKHFDIVIGNPPYISALAAKKTMSSKLRDNYKSWYVSAKGAYDIYLLFFERGLELLEGGGILSFISPTKFLSAKYAQAFRELTGEKLQRVVEFSNQKQFESAGVSTLISFFGGSVLENQKSVWTQSGLVAKSHEISLHSRSSLAEFPEQTWGHLIWGDYELVSAIYSRSVSLESLFDVSASSTAAEADIWTGYVTTQPSPTSLKILNTGTIRHHKNLWDLAPYSNKGLKIQKPYLETALIGERRREMFSSPKLIVGKLAKNIRASLDLNGEFASSNTVFVLPSNSSISIICLSGILNSKVMDYIFRTSFAGLNMLGSFQYQAPQIRILPVPSHVSKSIESEIERRVIKILSEDLDDTQIANEMTEIDNLVASAYQLKPDELDIINRSLG
jgi:type I restriction-modification system DNA methylase subunit